MFGLLANLYHWVKQKNERRATVVLLGLDNAGKTSVFNSLNGEGEKDTTPSFGFTRSTLKQGKYTVDVYDLGGGKNIRRIWNTYLPEVHGAVYVVDAADAARFEESKQVLQQVLSDKHLHGKPILVLANKQDLPAAAQPHQVASALGLSDHMQNHYNILPTCARQSPVELTDRNIGEAFKWLVSAIDSTFAALAPRVATEAAEQRQEELRKKKEREERARAMREERLRLEKEAAEQQELLQQGQQGLPPHSSELSRVSLPLHPAPPSHLAADNFADLEQAAQLAAQEQPGSTLPVVTACVVAEAESQRRPLLSPLLPLNNRVTPVIATP